MPGFMHDNGIVGAPSTGGEALCIRLARKPVAR